jgi:hypothetical protein
LNPGERIPPPPEEEAGLASIKNKRILNGIDDSSPPEADARRFKHIEKLKKSALHIRFVYLSENMIYK